MGAYIHIKPNLGSGRGSRCWFFCSSLPSLEWARLESKYPGGMFSKYSHPEILSRAKDIFHEGDFYSGFRDNCRWLTAPDWNTVLKCDGNEVKWKTVSFSPLDFSLCELLYVYAPNDSYSILFCNLYCLYFKVVVGGCSGGGGWGHKVSREVFFWERKTKTPHKGHKKTLHGKCNSMFI